MKERYAKAKNIIWREEGEEGILYNSDNGSIVALNTSAMIIWKLCDGKHGKKEISEFIMKKFTDTDPEKARHYLDEFIEKLKNQKMIEVRSTR